MEKSLSRAIANPAKIQGFSTFDPLTLKNEISFGYLLIFYDFCTPNPENGFTMSIEKDIYNHRKFSHHVKSMSDYG